MRTKSRKMILPLVIACALVLGGAIGSFALTSSGLPYESEDYKAQFYLNHLQVHLLENGKDVCGGQNTLDESGKVTGDLVQYLGYRGAEGTPVLGGVEPGRLYKEEIAAQNGQETPIYVRMTIRKYWMEENEDGELVKATALSPDRIRLSCGSSRYNTDAWFENEAESTDEQTTYYYRSQLGEGETTEPLFDSLVIDRKLLKKEETSRTTDAETGVTTIRYKYAYDGYAFFLKADVQAIQTHNADDAIKSQWGVDNIRESGGTLQLAD